eukprot:scaffold52525_cov75-Phaeocystis_antarctica.AAC.12
MPLKTRRVGIHSEEGDVSVEAGVVRKALRAHRRHVVAMGVGTLGEIVGGVEHDERGAELAPLPSTLCREKREAASGGERCGEHVTTPLRLRGTELPFLDQTCLREKRTLPPDF